MWAGRRLRAAGGQAVVEFALMAPLVLVLILGAVDFGQGFDARSAMLNLANQAGRYAEVNSCAPCGAQPIETYVKDNSGNNGLINGSGGFGVAPPGATISFCFPAGSTGAVGDSLEVNVSANYNWLPYFASYVGLPTSSTISAQAIVRIEEPYIQPPSSNAYSQVSTPPACS